ncbi:PREDICTED: glutamate receptor 2.3-like [Erythranthe guttata]|uniref:glutamate receptor 2.3-like n=1 Tax=Erythranthe guttata TaxID=4155 RepID=UPI00064DF592|nr:PREDICTED: glutamate receptor 2.3-like [Erythranthe guttata]|eukprot:XP_012853756.1 PREDICTED: glutamate receptor 2.3-like [Erythranthe guttata]
MEKINNTNLLYLLVYLLMINLKILSTKMAEAQIHVKVGVVLDMDAYGIMTFNCISTALSDFYATHDHYKTRLDLISRDSKGHVIGAAAAGVDLIKNVKVQAIIGPLYSIQANFLISLGNKSQVPIITFSATSPSLSSLRTPYFVRATHKDSSQVGPIVAIVKAFKWREVVPIHEDNEFGEGILPFLTDALKHANVRVPHTSAIAQSATDDEITAELYKLTRMQTRVFVVHLLNPLASTLFTLAARLGMMSEDYAWIVTDSVANDFSSMNISMLESMLGVIGVKPHVRQTRKLDDFALRYEKMFPRATNYYSPDVYGLWAYDSATALAMSAENAAGLGSLTAYQETNTSGNSTDLEAFGVSLSGPNLIRALSSTNFTGLAGEFRLVDGQLQTPPYEIVNIVGGAGNRTIGYWTKENGIVDELNVTSSSTKLGAVVWPGKGSSPPRGWVVGKKLRVGVPVKAGFTEFVNVTWNSDNSYNVNGYCIDVFRDVMAALPYNVSYEYIPFATSDHKAAGNYDDLVYQVYLGKYDAVAGDVTILGNRSQYVDFTAPYTETGISMVVPIQDDKRRNKWLFVKPLTWQLWLAIFLSTFLIGGLVSYSASLTSMMTIQKLQPTVTDVNVLVRHKYRVGYSNTSFIFEFLKNKFDESQLISFDTSEQMDELLSKGSSNGGIAAAFLEIPYIKMFLRKHCSKYTMAGPTYKAAGFGFVFPIDSPLVPDVSRAILNVTEGKEKVLDRETKSEGSKTECLDAENDLVPPKSLGISSFEVLFISVAAVGLAAAVVYLIRLFCGHNPNVLDNEPIIETEILELRELLKDFGERD